MSNYAKFSFQYSMELVPDNLQAHATGFVRMSYHQGGIYVGGGVVVFQSDTLSTDMVIIPRMMWRKVVKQVDEMFTLVDKEAKR